MSRKDSFSKRNGFNEIHEAPIMVRNDAPYEFRGILVDLAYEFGFKPASLRDLVCRQLRTRADQNNWSEYPNIDNEVRGLIDDCSWFKVYDILEMKAANKAIRANKTPETQAAALVALGFTEAQAAEAIKPDFAFSLSNNNANMTRMKGRIAELEKRSQRDDVEKAGDGFTYRYREPRKTA